MHSVLVAGGIDDVVLKIAHDELDRTPSVSRPCRQLTRPAIESATRTAQEIGAWHEVVTTDQLAIPAFVDDAAIASIAKLICIA
jgi:PP-loop superfamily ATP-utilizing enzyme